ncbi:MAG: CheR family methyltransferase [Ferruginibacter sp.]
MLRNSNDSSDIQFPVVGIGASAGGLEAIKSFLKGVPDQSGMAYVFVQHLSPGHESVLTEILSRHTKIPVIEITQDVALKPDHFYVIPADKMLTAVDGMLKLDPRSDKTKNLKVIDVFFSSLGVVHQSFAVGIILSGTMDDGTLGLQVIKAHGGITMVQDDTAAYEGMPNNAIRSGAADFILPPGNMVNKLIEINKPFHDVTADKAKNTDIAVEDEESFRRIITLLKIKKGVDFTHYKQTTIVRRIQRRVALNKCAGAQEYLELLRQNVKEQAELYADMIISVTDFFRDPRTFALLKDTVIPELFNSKNAYEPIRIWVAGCATGEEAYSIAICLEEYIAMSMNGRRNDRKIHIFATDLSEKAIAKARVGIYKESDLKTVSPERLERFFTKTDGAYQVNKSVRECCVFAQHNLLTDPPFSKIDLVACRNVLIYMEPVLQKRLLTIFHYSLTESSFLILGRSETIGTNTELFSLFNKQEKIYRKKGPTGRFMTVTSAGKEQLMRQQDDTVSEGKQPVVDVNKKAEEILLAKYTPAGVIINDHFDIVQFRGSTAAWLTLPPGKPTLNLMKMAKQGLAFELRNILLLAKNKHGAVKKEGVAIDSNGTQQYVTIEAVPITDLAEPHYLVLFNNTISYTNFGETNFGENGGNETRDPLLKRIEQLEKELTQNREDMRAITEDQQAANEELQSANEELLSGSEELQALNEELETAKEELQSTNEELTSLNHELLDRFEQLNVSRKYTEGVFATIRDPLIVLDHEFRVMKATAGFYKKFRISEAETEGKLLFDLLDKQWNIPALKQYLENIKSENSSFQDFEITQNFPFIGLRTLILNGRQIDRVDGNKTILLGIEDISHKRHAEESVAELEKVNEHLKHSNLELEQFAGIASHDLQEPLRKIMTFANIISEKNIEISEESKPYIAKIVSSAKRMSGIIKDLLNYSRITDVGQLLIPTNLGSILKNVVNDFELIIKEKDAEIIKKDLPIVPAIPLYMNQLFYNLINNALKFSRKNVPPRIEITSRPLSQEEVNAYPELNQQRHYAEITVKDNGIGFDEKYSEQVFDLFQRLSNGHEYPGTGIGLALCRKIVVQHGGKIYVQSKINEGSVFHIILPMQA